MRFFNYKIPKIAVDDLLHNRLAVAAMANFARVDAALVNQGFTASGITSGGDNEGYPYSIDVGWPTGETLRFKIPSTQVSREVERALYEFSGLDDVVRHLASVKLLPDLIPYDEWEASLKSEATDQD